MSKPVFIARQAAHPTGILGWIIAHVMSGETSWENRQTVDYLALKSGESVLDIGCGHGAILPRLRRAVEPGRVVGIDPSKTMISVARSKAKSGAIELFNGDVEALPFEDGAFDAALSVHTLYFWADPVKALREIRRVTTPTGRFVLCCRTTDDPGFAAAAPSEVYHGRSPAEVEALLAEAGWRVVRTESEQSRKALFHWFVCEAD
jgi:ubiquinone/menaquinone biosynthesis C-methylase UbiE